MIASQTHPQTRGSPAAVYEITIEGCLDACWEGWFDGMVMQVDTATRVTRLSGGLPDQAALHGVLARIRDLGLTLLTVRRVSDAGTESETSFHFVADSGVALDEFIALLDQVGEWLWNKGVMQWRPGVHTENREILKNQLEHGILVLAYQGELLAGGCVLSENPPAVWNNPSKHALYLGSLVVARFAAGHGLGKQIVERCVQVAREKGKSSLRLDCWDGNEFLKAYYQEAGFRMLGTAREADYDSRLFEMDIP